MALAASDAAPLDFSPLIFENSITESGDSLSTNHTDVIDHTLQARALKKKKKKINRKTPETSKSFKTPKTPKAPNSKVKSHRKKPLDAGGAASTAVASVNGQGIVPVQVHGKNRGWALPPDRTCLPDMWCPYACPSGMVSTQWDPAATLAHPSRQNGGLFCNSQGVVVKPFPNQPLCKPGVGNVSVLNKASAGVSFCQTTYPGDKSPVIPTWIPANAKVGLGVNGPDYWMSTGTAYYVNYPGIPPEEACMWGTKPVQVAKGNWAPIQFSAQKDATGMTYLTLVHNLITWEPDFHAPLRNNFGVRIRCQGKYVFTRFQRPTFSQPPTSKLAMPLLTELPAARKYDGESSESSESADVM
ncbi:hypothetical protein FPQ18DRAFT_395112 [Pyronema domesticum]|nr:hypothetical protein FPQ18DRAFT_395112 [Pyronema domesticum]